PADPAAHARAARPGAPARAEGPVQADVPVDLCGYCLKPPTERGVPARRRRGASAGSITFGGNGRPVKGPATGASGRAGSFAGGAAAGLCLKTAPGWPGGARPEPWRTGELGRRPGAMPVPPTPWVTCRVRQPDRRGVATSLPAPAWALRLPPCGQRRAG